MKTLATILENQKQFFLSGKTLPLSFRQQQLAKLKNAIMRDEQRIYAALEKDLGKPVLESFVSEVGFVCSDIDHVQKHLAKWMKPKCALTPLVHFRASSKIYSEPLGQVLVISPWNYPVQLLLSPAVGAMAAGNCVVLKPSELTPHTSALLTEILTQEFPPEYLAVIEGGVEETTELLKHPFDHIFFTGSTAVGKIVMQAAAKNLSPVTLELGGKSPCVVDETAGIEVAAKRITWGKFFNTGQTCVAPDYILAHHSVKKALLEEIQNCIREFYGADPQKSPDYGRIVNHRHFDRLSKLIAKDKVVIGGKTDRAEKYIEPTVMAAVGWNDPIMQEEIFGPILPVLEYQDIGVEIERLKRLPKPLAFYLFTEDRRIQEKIMKEISFGGGCINDTLIHLSTPHLPFGGVGPSGMGSYHGKKSFEVFSHQKSVVDRKITPEIPLRYPPYAGKLKWIRKIF